MVRDHFGLSPDQLAEPVFQRMRGSGVQHLPSAAEQRLIGGILQQCVLEYVGGVGRRPALEHDIGRD
jgi:hypothetical protein